MGDNDEPKKIVSVPHNSPANDAAKELNEILSTPDKIARRIAFASAFFAFCSLVVSLIALCLQFQNT